MNILIIIHMLGNAIPRDKFVGPFNSAEENTHLKILIQFHWENKERGSIALRRFFFSSCFTKEA